MSNHQNIAELKKKVDFGLKFWLQVEGNSILGKGWARLLESISNDQIKSLSKAAEKCNYSYKYAWNILKRIEKRTGMSPVITHKGGTGGGGTVELNEWGNFLLMVYNSMLEEVNNLKKNLEQKIKKLY
ncbi:MAG: hypothetical protein KGD63_08720 [Candidatus Lokiarchaeota archaeon]|nr:hypothetical protein [Candidatus Lokiarchaeota archaeon]